MSDLVVKSNKLNSVIQNLSLSEIRLVQLGIINARETGLGLSADKPLRIEAMEYAKSFGVDKTTAYKILRSAEERLFNRQFSFLEGNKKVKSHWVQRVKYLDEEGAIEIIFTIDVVNEISRLDGHEQFFTSYLLEQTSDMKSNYSVRLYELLVQWKTARKTPIFELNDFRGQLGLGVNDYPRMGNFKTRVLDKAVDEINKKSDLKVSYEQQKKGRQIVGFKFKIEEKKQKKKQQNKDENRDENTVDMFSGMTEKQIDFFAKKLANDSEFQSVFVAPMGANMSDYELLIKTKLQDEKQQQKWMKYLQKMGFKQ